MSKNTSPTSTQHGVVEVKSVRVENHYLLETTDEKHTQEVKDFLKSFVRRVGRFVNKKPMTNKATKQAVHVSSPQTMINEIIEENKKGDDPAVLFFCRFTEDERDDDYVRIGEENAFVLRIKFHGRKTNDYSTIRRILSSAAAQKVFEDTP
jgi:hypothetical protein